MCPPYFALQTQNHEPLVANVEKAECSNSTVISNVCEKSIRLLLKRHFTAFCMTKAIKQILRFTTNVIILQYVVLWVLIFS